MAQFGRPSSTVSNDIYTGVGDTTNLWENLNESTASDTDYNYSDDNSNGTFEVALNSLNDPSSSAGHIVRYRIAQFDGGVLGNGGGSSSSVETALYQGTTQIATSGAITTTSAWTSGSFTLSGTEADSITDYTDLRLRFTISGGGGSPNNRRGTGLSWAELELPDGVSLVTLDTTSISGSSTSSSSDVKKSYNLTSTSIVGASTLAVIALSVGVELGAGAINGTSSLSSTSISTGVDEILDTTAISGTSSTSTISLDNSYSLGVNTISGTSTLSISVVELDVNLSTSGLTGSSVSSSPTIESTYNLGVQSIAGIAVVSSASINTSGLLELNTSSIVGTSSSLGVSINKDLGINAGTIIGTSTLSSASIEVSFNVDAINGNSSISSLILKNNVNLLTGNVVSNSVLSSLNLNVAGGYAREIEGKVYNNDIEVIIPDVVYLIRQTDNVILGEVQEVTLNVNVSDDIIKVEV